MVSIYMVNNSNNYEVIAIYNGLTSRPSAVFPSFC